LVLKKIFYLISLKYGNDLVSPRNKWIWEALEFFEKQKWLTIKDSKDIEISITKFRSLKRDQLEIKYFSKIVHAEEVKKEKDRKSKEERKLIRKLKKAAKIKEKLGSGQKTLF
jgi:hypothetical protein